MLLGYLRSGLKNAKVFFLYGWPLVQFQKMNKSHNIFPGKKDENIDGKVLPRQYIAL